MPAIARHHIIACLHWLYVFLRALYVWHGALRALFWHGALYVHFARSAHRLRALTLARAAAVKQQSC
eukprot:6134558-Pleurochrysis_carterae.AAC.1